MTQKTGTLRDLNVKPGDVVEFAGRTDGWVDTALTGNRYTIMERHPDGLYGGLCGVGDGGWVEVDRPDSELLFRVISRASEPDTPKFLRDMTDAEIGALVRAHHEGKAIDIRGSIKWILCREPSWLPNCAYRVRPEPKRETVTLYGNKVTGRYWSQSCDRHDTHRITFDLIDGKPDLNSIKMEELE